MNGLDDVIRETIEKLKSISDNETIVGKPIINGDGTIILPVSKVSFGFVAGGGEYGEGNSKVKGERYPHSAVSGGGVTVTPVGFLVCGRDKKFISVDKTTDNKWLELAKAAFGIMKDNNDEK